MALSYRSFASIGKMCFSTSRPEKTINYFATKLGRRDLRTHQICCRSDAKWHLHMVVKYNRFVTFFSHLFFRFLGQSTVAILVRIARLMAQKSCCNWYTSLLRIWCLHIHYEGVSGPKNRQILTSKSLNFANFLQKIALTLGPQNYP